MKFIPAIGPYDIKVFGSQKGFLNKPIEFILRNENVPIQEILILNPNGNSSSCDILDNQLDGHLSLEFLPDTLGVHEIRIFSDKKNRSLYNSFEFNIYDSSKLTVKLNEEAIVGKLFKFFVHCKGLGDGNLYVYVEQLDRKLKPSIKHVQNDTKTNSISYQVSFVPEIESLCKIDLEYSDKYENILNGDSFKLNAKAIDYLVIPFPLLPFPINTRCSFQFKILRKFVKNLKIYIKPISSLNESDKQECELQLIEKDYYQVSFIPKTIERHSIDIYFGNQLVNSERPIKLDIFDVSKIVTLIPDKIIFGELNTFSVDTTGAGEGNLEVIIKDGVDTLKAQLLKREKRKFEIGFLCERNTKHDIQVVFNGISIKNSPFQILPEFAITKSIENICEMTSDDVNVMEGGPIENIQCSEKMWIIYDAQTSQYNDLQFLVIDDTTFPIKHTKIQLEDGRWRVEFIPTNIGIHKVQRVIQNENTTKIQTIFKVNVLHFSAHRTVYGYKLYSQDDSIQLVFDAADYKVQDIIPQINDPNDKILEKYECKYLSDYLAIKFKPRLTGSYQINFIDKTVQKTIASSPYKLIVHEPIKEIMRCSGVYDLTRLTIPAKNLVKDYRLNQFNVIVYDSRQNTIKNCVFFNKTKDLIIEFITRTEGLHKVYFYIDDDLVDDNPFFVYVNGETLVPNSLSSVFSPFTTFKTSLNNISMFNSQTSSTNDICNVSNTNSRSQLDSTSTSNTIAPLPNIAHGSIICAKKNIPFHFVIHNKNLQGLCVYDPLNEPVSFKLVEDDHENGSIIIIPKLEGAHKIVGLIEGRDFEAQLFVLAKPEYESLFEMDNYSTDNVVEKPYVIALKESNLEVDVYDPFGERVDVRYTGDNLATFIPRTTGYFKIYISDYHGPILGSPFYALIHSQKQPSETPCIESSGIRDTTMNEETKFVIRNKDLEIDVQIKDPYDNNLSLRKKRTSQGFLQVFYAPEIIGPHEIHIIKNGVKVLDEPIIIFVSDPNKVKVENLKRESLVNKIFSFNIDATQAGEGFIRVNIKDPKLNDILPEINELDDRKYLVSFIPEILGTYEFSLTFNKYHLIESPFKINIYESIDQFNKEPKKLQDELLLLDSNHLITDDQLADSNIEYELSNWNQQINNSLNKIMESTSQNQNKRALSPITDTSEEESGDSLVYRGETYIENVECLPDGTSHLLLRIEDNPDLIDTSNPNKARGRYKYRFKRIPLPETWNTQTTAESVDQMSQQNDSSIEFTDNFAEDFDPELIAITEKNDLVKPGPSGFVRRITNLEDIKEESETYSSSSLKSSTSGARRKESSKTKHFKVDSIDRSFDSCETLGDVVRSMTLSETESEGEINVANESLITKLKREKQKKINQEKTVIIEENYVIEPKSEEQSKSSKKDENSFVESQEKSKSTIDNAFKITTQESGKNKPKKKEKIIMKQNTEPSTGPKVLGDDKLSEKLKPEESIQYEYEQVIEHSDRSQHNTPEPDNQKNIQIENSQTKTTEYETKEKFKTTDNSLPDKVKTTTTEKTVLITETEEDKVIETIENEKNIEEFSYSQKRGRQGRISSNLKNNLAQLAERLNPVLIEPDEPLHTVTVSKKVSQSVSHEPSNFDLKYENEQSKCYVINPEKDLSSSSSSAPSFNQSGSNENIIEYYKLQPNQLKDIDFEDTPPKINLQPVDLNSLQTGEQFKPDETVSLNELASFSKGLTTRVSNTDSKQREDDEDSLAEIEENFVITFKPEESTPLVESELIPIKVDSPKEKSYYKPIETLTTHDFFKPESKSLDLIKAKFEKKDSIDKSRSSSRSNESVGKLPKSKFEIYDRESNSSKKSSDSESSSTRRLNLSRLNSDRSISTEEKSSPKILDFYKKSDDDSNRSNSNRDLSTDSLDKGVKSLLTKYERNSSRDSTSREVTTDSLEPKPVRKLSQNIVQLFDRKDSLESSNRSRSSYRSKPSDSEAVYIRSAKSSHSSTRSELIDKNDDVFIEKDSEKLSDPVSTSSTTQDRVRKLSKIFNEKSDKRESSQSDSPRSSTSSSDRKSRFEFKNETKSKERKLSDSFRKFEEKSKMLYEIPNDQKDFIEKPSKLQVENPNDSGVKELVSKYEKRPSQSSDDGQTSDKLKSPTIKKIVSALIDDSKPTSLPVSETSSVSSKKYSSSSDDTLSPTSPTSKQFKEEEKNIKKLISKYEIQKMLENLDEPNEIFYADTPLQKFDIDLPKKKLREHSVDHLFDTKEESESNDKGVKRLVDIYEKKPSVSSNESLSPDSLNGKSLKSKTESTSSLTKLGNFIDKYENLLPKDVKINQKDIEDFMRDEEETQVKPLSTVFRNDMTNLTAYVHIPGQTTTVKKGPKVKAVLRIDTPDTLKFNVTTETGHKVPFRVKQKNNQSFLMFNYHRVVDFNVGILNKNENGNVQKRYTAQLELKITDDYSFRIVKRDNLELVPIEVNKNSESFYEISFEPSATSSYILQASKNSSSNDEISQKSLQDYENIINFAKSEIHKKLNELKQPMKCLLQVEHRNPIFFIITNSLTDQPIENKISYKPKNRHIVYFDYETLTDFTINVQKDKVRQDFGYYLNKQAEELLNALIEINVSNEYEFQIVRKDTQEPLKLYIEPKINDTYKIIFNPKPLVKYTIKANQLKSLSENSHDKTKVTSKLNQLIDKLPTEMFMPSGDSDVKLKVSVTNPSTNNRPNNSVLSDNLNNPQINCSVYNPRNFEVSELPSSKSGISYLVNTKTSGPGCLKCYATHLDGVPAFIEQLQLDKFIYSVRVHGNNKTGSFKLYLDYINA